MDTPTDNVLALHATCRKLNQLYHDLAEGEWLGKGDPFIVTQLAGDLTAPGAWVIAVEPGFDREWEIATVLEKVLRRELPRRTSHKIYDRKLPTPVGE